MSSSMHVFTFKVDEINETSCIPDILKISSFIRLSLYYTVFTTDIPRVLLIAIIVVNYSYSCKRFNGIRLIPTFCMYVRGWKSSMFQAHSGHEEMLHTSARSHVQFQIPNSHVDASSSHVPLWQAKEVRYIAEPETILEIARSRGAARGPEFPLP